MVVVRENTYKGKQLLNSANNFIGFELCDVYTSYSKAKEKAWEHCFELYLSDDKATNFRIIAANTFGFSVAWNTPEGVRIETPKNSYFIDCM